MYYLLLFVGMFALFAICGLILFNATNKNTLESPKRSRTKLTWMTFVMFGSQFIILGIFLSLIFQMFLLNSYQIIFIDIAVYVTHLSALLFLSFLVVTLVKSVRSNKNLMLLSYAASFSLIVSISHYFIHLPCHSDKFSCAREEVQFEYLYQFTFLLQVLRQHLTCKFYLVQFLIYCLLDHLCQSWIATAVLLRQYRQRIGKMKYWCLIVAPLIYFLFPFGTYFINLSDELMAKFTSAI